MIDLFCTPYMVNYPAYHFISIFVGVMDPSHNDSETFLSDVFQFHSTSPQQLVQKHSAQEEGPKLLSPIDFMQCPYKGKVISPGKEFSPQKDVQIHSSNKLFHYFQKPAYRQTGLTYAQVVKRHIFMDNNYLLNQQILSLKAVGLFPLFTT